MLAGPSNALKPYFNEQKQSFQYLKPVEPDDDKKTNAFHDKIDEEPKIRLFVEFSRDFGLG